MSLLGKNLLVNCAVISFILIAGIFTVVLIRTLTFGHGIPPIKPCRPSDADFINATGAPLERFRQAIRFKTINWGPDEIETGEFLKLINFIKKEYPHIHSSPYIKLEIVNTYSMLYTVRGSQPDLQPYLLAAHTDVVPAVELEKWSHDPFGAELTDGFVYGRGTIDIKQIVMGILEALEYIISRGGQPKRSFYIAFGHDEETRGYDGAAKIAQILEHRSVRLLYVLDEGMVITENILPGALAPVALVGTSKKGNMFIKLSVNVTGGHSCIPLPDSSIGILSAAVARLEKYPQPSMLGTGDEVAMFENIASVLSLSVRMLMSNLWLFGPLVSKFMSMQPVSNAIIRTTTAVTTFNAGIKSNVIAPYAEAIVNHRIHPSQTTKDVLAYDISIIDDPRVKVEVFDDSEPLPPSPHDEHSFGYQTVAMSIRQVWSTDGKFVVAPGIFLGDADCLWYKNLTDSLYMFGPSYFYPGDPQRLHGVNERITVKNYEQAINFYYHLITNSDKTSVPEVHTHSDEL